MTYVTPALEAALRTLFEELPKVASAATSVDVCVYPRCGAGLFWQVSIQRNGMLFSSGENERRYPRTADALVADMEAGLEALNGSKVTPLEYGEAEFGPIFGKSPA